MTTTTQDKEVTAANFQQLRQFIESDTQIIAGINFDKDDRRAIYDALEIDVDSSAFLCDRNQVTDFTVETSEGEFRFIGVNEIDDIQQDELSSDAYILGCFNSDFLASVTGWPELLIKAGQDGEAYEQIGQAIIDSDLVEDLQDLYRRVDGYGHHFASYDHNEYDVSLLEANYYMFRTN